MDVGIVSSLLPDAESVRDAVHRAGGTPVDADLETVDTADVAVVPTVGEEAVRRAADVGVTTPLLAVDTLAGLRAVPEDALVDALKAVDAGRAEPLDQLAITVRVPGEPDATAIREVSLLTDRPATISEFEIAAADERVAEYRADGAVVATPAGTTGYARTAGGPIMAPGTDALAVVTIAPYRVDPDHWVVDPSGVRITVTRDESRVVGLADGHAVGSVETGEPVRIEADRSFRTLRVPLSLSPYSAEDTVDEAD